MVLRGAVPGAAARDSRARACLTHQTPIAKIESSYRQTKSRYRLGVRTRGSQPRDRGSNPRTGTTLPSRLTRRLPTEGRRQFKRAKVDRIQSRDTNTI